VKTDGLKTFVTFFFYSLAILDFAKINYLLKINIYDYLKVSKTSRKIIFQRPMVQDGGLIPF
jgi:hypothetical protein